MTRALVVDDERLARSHLRHLLAAHGGVEVVGEADGVAEAARLVGALAPDVVFLDVQLRGETGFDLVGRLDPTRSPAIVFVTAFDRHAVRAFEVDAVDYLLKPVEPERLAASLARVARSRAPATADGPAGVAPDARPLALDDRLLVEIARRPQLVAVREIVCVVAQDDFTELRLRDGRRPLVLSTMAAWERRLPPRHFVRVHRSAIVQFDAVARLEPWSHGGYMARIHGIAEPVPISRRYAKALRDRLR